MTTHSPPAPGGCAQASQPGARWMASPANARGRRVGCAAGSGSPTGECSAASCRQSATERCISDCCTPNRTGWSSSPPAPDATGRFTSTPARVPTTSSPAAPPARPDGSRRCSRSRPSHADRGEELFIAPAVRSHARGEKHAVAHTRALWVDIDQPGQLHHLWALLAEKPCHLLVESGGGGAHAYWLLDKPLPATDQNQPAGLRADPIERAHARIIHRLGVDGHGRPNVADPACKDRSRLMRLGGSVNGKTGRPRADPRGRLPARPLRDRAARRRPPRPDATRQRRDDIGRRVEHQDPYKRISPPEYFEQLAGIQVPRGGLVRCPAPWHEDQHPSCSVGTDSTSGWKCHALRLRRGRSDLRPRLGPARRPVGPRAARRAVQTRPRLRRRRVRRTRLTPSNPHEGSLDAHAHP